MDIVATVGGDVAVAKSELLASRSKNRKNTTTPVLDQYARDLNQFAVDGKIDPPGDLCAAVHGVVK